MNLAVWAFEVIRDGNISEDEFAAELPRIGALLESVKPVGLKNMLVNLTMQGIPLRDVLTDIEKINDILFRAAREALETFGGLKETLSNG